MDNFFVSLCGSGGCDAAGTWLAALLTLFVLSYLIRDSFLFRLASSLLVGTAVGYGFAVILNTVLWQRLVMPLLLDIPSLWSHSWPLFVPLFLGFLLVARLVPGWQGWGNWSLGYLFGAGAALAIGGALGGALVPQLLASIVSIAPGASVGNSINNLLILVGTLGVLLTFRFTVVAGSPLTRAYGRIAGAWGTAGRGFMLVALGAIFANTFTARVSVLVNQIYFLLHNWLGVVK